MLLRLYMFRYLFWAWRAAFIVKVADDFSG